MTAVGATRRPEQPDGRSDPTAGATADQEKNKKRCPTCRARRQVGFTAGDAFVVLQEN